MSGFNRSFTLLRAAMRHQLIPKANITAKPAKHKLSTGEQVIAMSVMFVTILGPSGWILSHLEDYKHRPGAAQE
ncbi:cytochrome c oxidase subunit 8B, mitochondrial [Danio aesculapii]|uniref:cytochrome c oxidase subunit 8B, mitochondrial n=1 Tax=Danio aesculapii TaxID=1142201 RepID=UPI0024C05135|nr:cytochrome c oxidase subunit 8B, mitochondrial [Danio aesculapii]